jgi:UrcA family protein
MKTAIKTQSLFTASVVAASFLAFGGAAMGGRVQAAEPAQSYTTIVSYRDLNLDSEQGAKVLYGRIRGAAGSVCSSLEGRGLAFGASRLGSCGPAPALLCRACNRVAPSGLLTSTATRVPNQLRSGLRIGSRNAIGKPFGGPDLR